MKASRKALLEFSARPFSKLSEVFHELSEENFLVKATENRVGKAHSENLS